VRLQPRRDLAFFASGLIFRLTVQSGRQTRRQGVLVRASATPLAESSHEGGCQGTLSIVDRHEPILFAVSLFGGRLRSGEQTRSACDRHIPLVTGHTPGSQRWF